MIHAPVLVLNRHYLPVHVTSVKRALCLLYRGTARVLSDQMRVFDFHAWRTLPVKPSDPALGLVNGRLRVPQIILLATFDGQPRRTLRFSRILVLIRDQYTCQYCGQTQPLSELNLDHVIPKRYGGTSSWDNVVCCCLRCNRQKGGRTPEEADMDLLRLPRAPRYTSLTHLVPHHNFLEEWRPFLAPPNQKRVLF